MQKIIWPITIAVCVIAIVAGITVSDIFSPPETALHRCATDLIARGSNFCLSLSSTREEK